MGLYAVPKFALFHNRQIIKSAKKSHRKMKTPCWKKNQV